MTGPEHYTEAERSLAVAESTYWEGPDARIEFAQTALMAAQAHATLALAAVFALQIVATQPPHVTEAGKDWRAVLQPAPDAATS